VEPRVFCCDLLLALFSTLHLAICGGCTVTRSRPKPLKADAARVTNSGECKNEFSYILAESIGSGSSFLHPERWIHHTFLCTRLLSQSVQRESRTVAKFAFLEPISNSDVPSDAVVDIFIQRSVLFFWYFWLAIQNTVNRHVSKAFDLIGVFISFSLAHCCHCCGSCGSLLLLLRAPTPPRPPFLGREVPKKENRL
jgi:hypothetical protein